ncbi:hypothetical protein GGR50DRAFT_691234 [Xylaria sp. CBS 124048]|nr:hypothetical protein GGR50DRAFT_691234 [Xylaria sp. CBS 124048]
MSPTYTMSAHLCKEIYKSFQNRQTSPELYMSSRPSSSSPTAATLSVSPWPAIMPRRSPSPDKRTGVQVGVP